MTIEESKVGKRIRSARKKNKISQLKLAELADCSMSYISYVENGRKSMSLSTFVKIANALHCTADELLLDVLNNTTAARANKWADLVSDLTPNEQVVLFDILTVSKNSMRRNK